MPQIDQLRSLLLLLPIQHVLQRHRVLLGLLLVSKFETKAELVEQKDRGFLLVLDLTGFNLGIIPGLWVLFLVSVDP